MSTPRMSVVTATYNRIASLRRLLGDLQQQTLPPTDFEVVVVDDGSTPPVGPALADDTPSYDLRLITQPNQGAAAARHHGAVEARGELLVFVDDDMELHPWFLAEHAAVHAETPRAVVLGQMRRGPGFDQMPLFERWHQRMLDRLGEDFLSGAARPRGSHLYTGNVSLPRAEYLAVGGFDRELGHSEDAELGLRLEQAGCKFVYSERAYSVHRSDHASLQKWLTRAYRYGRFDAKIGRKHPRLAEADPWRFVFELNPVSRPLLLATLGAPKLGDLLARALMRLAEPMDRAGSERAAMAATTLAFGLQYFQGLRDDAGSAKTSAKEIFRHLAQHRLPPKQLRAVALQLVEELRADQATMRRYEAKYGHRSPSDGNLAADVAQKIGLQILAGYRLMRALRTAGLLGAAKAVSRLIRHLHGSDLHWEADFAPGVMIVHGMGMAISHQARVDEGCILFQHVTLGMGTDPLTGAVGAPTLERNVHVGPGATLLGPIRIGEGSKIMAGAVVTESVPPHSVVRAPAPTVVSRSSNRGAAANAANATEPSVNEHAAGSL